MTKEATFRMILFAAVLATVGGIFYFNQPHKTVNALPVLAQQKSKTVLPEQKEWAKNARIDVKATTARPDKQLHVFLGANELERAAWGKEIDTYSIAKDNKKIEFSIDPIADTNATILLRGPYGKNPDGTHKKMWVKYTSLKVNGEEVLKGQQTVWHDKPFTYKLDVKKGKKYNIEVNWDNK